jgi:uncharacterized protein YjbJ (UPF0337 family)
MGLIDKVRTEVDEVVGKLEEVAGKVSGNEALREWGEAKHEAAEGHEQHLQEAVDESAPSDSV